MKVEDAFLRQPDWLHESPIRLCSAFLVTAVGHGHTLTGLVCEFRASFIVPSSVDARQIDDPYAVKRLSGPSEGAPDG